MSYLLSIVVPTKNRYKYLKHLIKLVDNYDLNELELVIQDNSDDNEEIVEYLKEFAHNENIKYYYSSDQLSQSGNSDRAILSSNGEYVCFIGDDDGVTKHIVDCVRFMKKENIDVLMNNIVSYHWPDYYSGSPLSYSGLITYDNYKNNITHINSKCVLDDIIDKGFINRGKLPLVYHGIVRRRLLDEIYKIGKTFFPGSSPDIANAVSLALTIDTFVYMDFPIVISGASKHHGGGIRAMKNRAAKIEDVPYLPKNAKENWEKNIPRVWTGETVWCESAIKALRYMNREELIKKVNFENMYAHFIAFHFPLRKLAYDLCPNKFKLFFLSSLIIIKRYFRAGIKLIRSKIYGKVKSENMIGNVQDINTCVDILHEKVSRFPF